MFDYQEGSKSGSLCATCEKKVLSTLKNETISLCEGLEEVENVLVAVCDVCGNMTAVPAKSLPPLQDAFKRLVETGVVADYGEITTELKSQVDARKARDSKSELDNQFVYSL